MTQLSTHERLTGEEHIAPSSERSFALVMTGVFTLIGAFNRWHEGRVWAWFIGIAFFLLFAGLFWPSILKPINRLWFKFGLMLHAVINPVVMGLLFYIAVWPTGLVMRAMGKDPLRLQLEPERDSYWIARQPPGPAPDSMRDQF
jgi:Saxitoxin biosynthesis operon protein SxtJ